MRFTQEYTLGRVVVGQQHKGRWDVFQKHLQYVTKCAETVNLKQEAKALHASLAYMHTYFNSSPTETMQKRLREQIIDVAIRTKNYDFLWNALDIQTNNYELYSWVFPSKEQVFRVMGMDDPLLLDVIWGSYKDTEGEDDWDHDCAIASFSILLENVKDRKSFQLYTYAHEVSSASLSEVLFWNVTRSYYDDAMALEPFAHAASIELWDPYLPEYDSLLSDNNSEDTPYPDSP